MSSNVEDCYCARIANEPFFTCTACKKRFHSKCLKSGLPSPLVGDVYFKFTCAICAADSTEVFERIKLQWTTVLLLSLYNLQLQGGGKCGYFRWREHICRFIDQNWSTFFGTDKKKSRTWHGTVAGCLSNGANRYFLSSVEVLGETGWWTLKSYDLPTLEELETTESHIKQKRKHQFAFSDADEAESFIPEALSLKVKKKCIIDNTKVKNDKLTLIAKFTMMSIYEEEQLLDKLKSNLCDIKQRPEIRHLYRKLVVRKLKRAKSLPLFDIDAEVRMLGGMDLPEYFGREDVSKNNNKSDLINKSMILDRFFLNPQTVRSKYPEYSSFITRLIGTENEQLNSFISPYTERILKPFIFRDYDTKPLKLKLMEEIIAHTNKSNPDFVLSKQNSIDYSYVRPQHILAVNALCQQYFWPGIDLSEALQYPDFSCVAQYRKIIIGFAFMVPDVKFNEAYITFIFVHPEWRRAGIASFMLYHLIQTCMGKDVTLHVSATSSAVYLYKKMGFKVEEFIQNYYDKYLPAKSKECRHALFLRLTR